MPRSPAPIRTTRAAIANTTFKVSTRRPKHSCEPAHRPAEEPAMPTFDGGHYFLTAVVPIRTAAVEDDLAVTSPVHALRKRLSLIPTGAETPARGGGQSPFARNKRNHFARLVIIDDVAYTGRAGRNTLWGLVRGVDLAVAQPQDHLKCPFLIFVVDFDAKSDAD